MTFDHSTHGVRNSDGRRHVSSAGGGHDHAAMIKDFRRRFWACLVLTLPILALSPMIQAVVGIDDELAFAGSDYVLFGLLAAVFFYGGWPFLIGSIDEVRKGLPDRRPRGSRCQMQWLGAVSKPSAPPRTAFDILKERIARGEIGEAEFQDRRHARSD